MKKEVWNIEIRNVGFSITTITLRTDIVTSDIATQIPYIYRVS